MRADAHQPLRGRPPTASPGRRGDDLLALTTRLTGRDQWLLRMLAEHPVLTSIQISDLAFDTRRRANRRLAALAARRLLTRFQPAVPTGSPPYHYLLGPAGAAILAARTGAPSAQLYRRSRVEAIAYSRRLTHDRATAGLMVALAAHTRTHPDTRLTAWWSERTTSDALGELARPDAYGHWRVGAQHLAFLLEYDTGSESLEQVTAKLDAYTRLGPIGVDLPILFWLPNPAREENLRQRLAADTGQHELRIATAHTTPDGVIDPAGPVWRPATDTWATTRPRRLVELWPDTPTNPLTVDLLDTNRPPPPAPRPPSR